MAAMCVAARVRVCRVEKKTTVQHNQDRVHVDLEMAEGAVAALLYLLRAQTAHDLRRGWRSRES